MKNLHYKYLIAWSLILGLIVLIIKNGFYINLFDNSMPAGIYKRINEKPKKGSFAITCLSQEIAWYGLERGYLRRGLCSTGIQPVLKRVMAIEGDTLSFNTGLIFINGKLVDGYRIWELDSSKRPLKVFYANGHYIVKKNEYWLMSNHKPNSWDSRYWGAVPVEGLVKPVLVFNGESDYERRE